VGFFAQRTSFGLPRGFLDIAARPVVVSHQDQEGIFILRHKEDEMKRWVWMVISLILAYVPLLIPLEGGHGLEPQEKWVARYNGPAYGFDYAKAIAVDSSGNVYVTGTSKGSDTGNDYATIKYNTNGKQLWVKRYNGPAYGNDFAGAIAVDSSGNVYVTGASDCSGTYSTDCATIKYNTNGKQLWVKTYNGPAKKGDDGASAIAVDSSGNVYVTGTSEGSDTGDDYVTIKYNTNGKQLWVKRYNGPAKKEDSASAIAVDSSGNVYVTGGSEGSGTSDDYATIKYNTNGKQLWVKTYNGPAYGNDFAGAIAVDSSGNVYVTGSSSNRLSGYENSDYATIKYNTNGKQLWVKRYNRVAVGWNWASAIAVDSSGNVYVTGASYGTSYDYATIKYDTNGKQLWVKTYNGPAKKEDEAKAIAVDSSGNVYVTGYSEGSGTSDDYATIKYNTNGKQLWVKTYNGPAKKEDSASAIAVDSSGNVYVTGYSYGLDGTGDYTTIKY
jgi:uncharacterized delta-60 repeat protein